MDDPVIRCTQLGPNFLTLASAPLSWYVADGQIKNRIALTERFINFNETEVFCPELNVQNFKL